MNRALLLLGLLAFNVYAADEVPLSEYIDQQQEGRFLDTSEIPSSSMADVQEKTLSEFIDSQGFDDTPIETDQLPSDSEILQDTDEIDLDNEFVNNLEYQDERDQSEYEQQANHDAEANSCPRSSEEETVCANVICDFGLTMGEWSSACTQHKLDLMLLKMRTPPWEDLPTCKMLDGACRVIGEAFAQEADGDFCNKISDPKERHACKVGLEASEEEGASAYVEKHGGDTTALDALEFEETEEEHKNQSPLVQFDQRYANEERLLKHNGGRSAQNLSSYLENRNPSLARVLIQQGVLQVRCTEVELDEFYNCNQYPDLPPQCWSAPDHESVVQCLHKLDR